MSVRRWFSDGKKISKFKKKFILKCQYPKNNSVTNNNYSIIGNNNQQLINNTVSHTNKKIYINDCDKSKLNIYLDKLINDEKVDINDKEIISEIKKSLKNDSYTQEDNKNLIDILNKYLNISADLATIISFLKGFF